MVDINKLDNYVNLLSLIGWAFIIYEAFTESSLQMWTSGITFLVMGIGLGSIAGIRALSKILDDGKIDVMESFRLAVVLLAVFSIFTGIALLPLPMLAFLRIPALISTRGIIAVFAFFFVLLKAIADFTSK